MAASEESGARQAMIGACLEMNRAGINQGTAGNISVRWKSGLLITPSGVPYGEMTVDDIVFMDMDGGYTHRLAASSEWRFHRDILQARGDVNAVVHAHPVYATAFALRHGDTGGALHDCRRRRAGNSLRALCHLWNRGTIQGGAGSTERPRLRASRQSRDDRDRPGSPRGDVACR